MQAPGVPESQQPEGMRKHLPEFLARETILFLPPRLTLTFDHTFTILSPLCTRHYTC